jgi:hyperosmotically inducible protein
MKTSHLIAAFVLLGLVAGPMAACSSTPKHQSTGEYIDDAALSNKVRAHLLDDEDLNVFQIDVTTNNGVVQLSGVVNSQAVKDRATRVVSKIEGVKQVRNTLLVQ